MVSHVCGSCHCACVGVVSRHPAVVPSCCLPWSALLFLAMCTLTCICFVMYTLTCMWSGEDILAFNDTVERAMDVRDPRCVSFTDCPGTWLATGTAFGCLYS
jgi:hypothetical protein